MAVPKIDMSALRAEVARRWARGGRKNLAEVTGYSAGYLALVFRGLPPSEGLLAAILESLGPDAAEAICPDYLPRRSEGKR